MIPGFLKNTVPQFSQKAQDVFALFTGGNALTEFEKRCMALTIDLLVESGVWDQIHEIQAGRGLSSEAKCLIGWKGKKNATGTGTWNINTGIQTNGTSNFINNNVIESSDCVNLDGSSTLNNCAFAVENMSNDHGTSVGTIFGVVGSAAARQIRYQQAAGGVNRTWKFHTSSTVTEALGVFQSGKWHTLYRSLSNRQGTEYDFDGLTTNGTASSNIPDRVMYVGALNNNGTAQDFYAGKFGTMVWFNYNQFDYTNFYIHWRYFMQMLGASTKDDLYPYDKVVSYYKPTDALIVKLNGQSNASGRATGLTAKYAVPLNAQVIWTTANPPVLATPMVIQQLQYGKNQSFDNLAESGYELSLCYSLAKRTIAKVVLDKYSKAGTDLQGIAAPGTWKVSSADMANISENVVSVRGWQIIDDTLNIKKVFFIYDQHESDITENTSQATYNLELSNLIKYNIDQHQAAGYSFSTIEFHVMIRKAWSGLAGAGLANITAAQVGQQAYFAANFPTENALVRSWTLFNSENYQFPDGTHLSPRSYELIGLGLGMLIARM